jgi:hypothetical protein
MTLGYMSEKLFCHLIDQCPPGTTILPFWRGESLLHPNFVELLYYAISRKMDVVLATNGSHMTEFRSQLGLIKKLKAINVSLHNMDSYAAYLWLKQVKDATHSEVEIQLSYVDGEHTDIPDELIKLLTPRIYKQHSFHGIWGATEDISDISYPYQDWCQRLDTDLVVTWGGGVSRCCYVWEPIQGLDANVQTLEEIYYNPAYSRIITNYPDYICSNCDQWRGEGRTL